MTRDQEAVEEEWPCENLFLLNDLDAIRKIRSREGRWIGVYVGPYGPLLAASQSPRLLHSRVKKHSPTLPVVLCRAESRKDLPARLKADKPDGFLELRQSTYRAIASARNTVRNSMGLYSASEEARARNFLRILGNSRRHLRDRLEELRLQPRAGHADHFIVQIAKAFEASEAAQETAVNAGQRYSPEKVQIARYFLRSIRNECRNTGRPLGDKPRAEENRKILDVLTRLARGESLKEIALDLYGPYRFEKGIRSFSVRLSRFSRRVHTELVQQYGAVSEGFLQPKSALYLSSFFGSIKQWPGVKSNSLSDGLALSEALKRYKPLSSDPGVRQWHGTFSQL